MNLIEGIQQECNRVRDELLPAYEAIGPAGVLGAIMLRETIKRGERAIASGNVIEVLAAYEALKGCE